MKAERGHFHAQGPRRNAKPRRSPSLATDLSATLGKHADDVFLLDRRKRSVSPCE